MESYKNDKDVFLSKLKILEGGCWEWQGAISSSGYGSVRFKGKTWVASRLSYYLHFSEIPSDIFVCHKCDNTKCCNPDHLFLGTCKDNVQDMMSKNRNVNPYTHKSMRTHCKKAGHEFTEENTLITTKGSRSCKKCAKLRKDRFEERKRSKK